MKNYGSYSPPQPYEIGKYAAEKCPSTAARKCSKLFPKKLNESRVRGFKRDYLNHVKSVKRKLADMDGSEDSDPEILKTKKRGRKLLLGDERDNQVKRFVGQKYKIVWQRMDPPSPFINWDQTGLHIVPVLQ